MFEFANFLLLALFAAAAFDGVTALIAAPGRGVCRLRAAFLDRWQREHLLFGGWGAAWRERLGGVLFAVGLAAYQFTVAFCNSMARVQWDWVQGSLSPVLDWVAFLCFGAKILLGTRLHLAVAGGGGLSVFHRPLDLFSTSQNIWWIGIILAVMAAKGTALPPAAAGLFRRRAGRGAADRFAVFCGMDTRRFRQRPGGGGGAAPSATVTPTPSAAWSLA